MEENEVYLAAQEVLDGILDFIFSNLDEKYILTDEDEVLRKDMMIDEDIFMEDNEDKTLQKDERNYLRSQEKKIEGNKKFLNDHQSEEKNIEVDNNFLKNLKSHEKIEVDDMFVMDLKSQERKIEEDDMFLKEERKIEEDNFFPKNLESQEKIEVDDMSLKSLKSQEKKIEENKNYLKIEIDDMFVMDLKSQEKTIKENEVTKIKFLDADIKERVKGNEDKDIKERVKDNEVKDEESGEQFKFNIKESDVALGSSDIMISCQKEIESIDLRQHVQGEELLELSKEVGEILESSELVKNGTWEVLETIKISESANKQEFGINLEPAKNGDTVDKEGKYTKV